MSFCEVLWPCGMRNGGKQGLFSFLARFAQDSRVIMTGFSNPSHESGCVCMTTKPSGHPSRALPVSLLRAGWCEIVQAAEGGGGGVGASASYTFIASGRPAFRARFQRYIYRLAASLQEFDVYSRRIHIQENVGMAVVFWGDILLLKEKFLVQQICTRSSQSLLPSERPRVPEASIRWCSNDSPYFHRFTCLSDGHDVLMSVVPFGFSLQPIVSKYVLCLGTGTRPRCFECLNCPVERSTSCTLNYIFPSSLLQRCPTHPLFALSAILGRAPPHTPKHCRMLLVLFREAHNTDFC